MIKMLYFKGKYRTFKPEDAILFFEGVNLLVGDQGCGKSTILQCLASLGGCKVPFWKKDRKEDIAKVAELLVDKPAPVFAHDYENDSPRTSPSFETMGSIPMGSAISFMKGSHGQATIALASAISDMKDAYLILDEPDSGLSCRSALTLVDAFKKAASNGCQIIASVHHPWVIESFSCVYSVEHKNYMKPEDFLQSMREPRKKSEVFGE